MFGVTIKLQWFVFKLLNIYLNLVSTAIQRLHLSEFEFLFQNCEHFHVNRHLLKHWFEIQLVTNCLGTVVSSCTNILTLRGALNYLQLLVYQNTTLPEYYSTRILLLILIFSVVFDDFDQTSHTFSESLSLWLSVAKIWSSYLFLLTKISFFPCLAFFSSMD